MAKEPAQANEKATKDRILSAAIDEFIEYGYYGARTQRIAQRAKVNKAMLHYYYGNKENIYSLAVQNVLDLLLTELDKIPDSDDPVEVKMEQIMDAYINMFTKNHSKIRMLLYELTRGGGELKKFVLKNFNRVPFNPMTGSIYKYFERKMKKGELRKMNPLHLIISIISQVMPVYFAREIVGDIGGSMGLNKLVINKFIDERKKVVLQMMMEGIKK